MQKKKIYSLITGLYGGGAEKSVAYLSCFLNEKYNHSIITNTSSEKKYPYCGKLINYPRQGKFLGYDFFNHLRNIKKLKNKTNPSVSISHLWISNVQNCLTKNQDKIIITMRGRWSITPDKGKLMDIITSKIYNKADHVICVSYYMKNLYEEFYGKQRNISVIYNGIDLESVKDLSKENKLDLPENFLVYVAGFRPVKNHIGLLRNLRTFLLQSDYKLILVGDGPLREEIKNEISENDLENSVILLGNLENPHSVVAHAKFSILSSENESFGLVLIEAMSLGIPVISTDCGGPREIILPEKINESVEYPIQSNGCILIPTDLSLNIGELIQNIDQDNYEKLSKAAKLRAQDFNIKTCAENYIRLIDTISNE